MADLSALSNNFPPKEPNTFEITSVRAHNAPEPKANLIIGSYRNEYGLQPPLNVVREAERWLWEKQESKDYSLVGGSINFLDATLKHVFGDTMPPRNQIAAVQTVGATHALHILSKILSNLIPIDTPIYISDPHFYYHRKVFENTGFKNIQLYRYYHSDTKALDFEGMINDLASAPDGSVVILQAGAHNPTGIDPSHEQWTTILSLIDHHHHIPIVDFPYHGFVTGDFHEDSFLCRAIATSGLQFFLTYTYSKSMGLYGERVGMLCVATNTPESTDKYLHFFQEYELVTIAIPPSHGANIAYTVLSDPKLRKAWAAEVMQMTQRIHSMRVALVSELQALNTPRDWSHISVQKGMFSYLGLSPEECEQLCNMNCFVLPSSRACIAALNHSTVKLLAKAIDTVVRQNQN